MERGAVKRRRKKGTMDKTDRGKGDGKGNDGQWKGGRSVDGKGNDG